MSRSTHKHIWCILTITLLLLPVLTSLTQTATSANSTQTTDLHLLRVEHYLYLEATENTQPFTLHFSFPPDYAHQTPIYLEFFNDTSPKLLHHHLEPDTLAPNLLLTCNIAALQKNEQILLHFTCWVIINTHNYEHIPNNVPLPHSKDELPENTQKWLQSTPVTQTNNPLIKHKARQLQRFTNNILTLGDRTAWFIKNHRYALFLLQLNLNIFFSQDAVTTLLINGDNVGRAHLASAIFRANIIPARILLTLGDQPFWTQMHYIMEYYVPPYGWVIIDTTRAHNFHEPHRQIILRICHPEDEYDTKTDYIFPLMKGEERWLWLTTTKVHPYYNDCDTGSKSRMFSEAITTSDPFTADYTQFLTRFTFTYYQQYLGFNFTGTNQQHYNNATSYQYNALHTLQTTQNIHTYIIQLNNALYEYQQIHLP